MRKLLAILVLMIPGAALAQQTTAKPPAKLTLYKTADSAACSGHAAVWVHSETHVYYLKGDKFFGKTKHGGYESRPMPLATTHRRLLLQNEPALFLKLSLVNLALGETLLQNLHGA